jgi:nucleoside-diphosphate-sugar epimerase
MLHFHARITGLTLRELERDNVLSTENCIEAARKYGVKYIVHTSSSVVLAKADDYYTITKTKQEALIENCGIPHSILRPTLMFGWFDKEHFGWLFRFMQKCPIFPVPGKGDFLRQPLYYRDMASCCIAAMEKRYEGSYNITGCEEITYIDMMREIKRIRRLHTLIMPIPIWLFKFLLDLYAVFFKNPPFTSQQLAALAAGDKFDLDPWWEEFGVKPTPLKEAMTVSFTRGENSEIELKKERLK